MAGAHPLERDILGSGGRSGYVTMDLGAFPSVSVLGLNEYVITSATGIERTFTQVEGFARLVHGTLNPTEVAYHVANEGRKLIECDRLSVAIRKGNKCIVEAISALEVQPAARQRWMPKGREPGTTRPTGLRMSS